VDPARHPGKHGRSPLKRGGSRWLRPPRRLRPTRAGWLFFVIVFGVGFAALNTGNNLLYLVLSLMLSFLVLSGVLSESALRGIHVTRRLPRELFAGSESPAVLEISNRQRRMPALAIMVEDHLSLDDAAERGATRSAGRALALRVEPGGREACRYPLCPERRGPLHFAGFTVSTLFPFGLFRKSLEIDAKGQALVYPALDPTSHSPCLGSADDHGETATTSEGQGPDVAGLREFRPGDLVRRVHWKSTLRRGALLLRELEDERAAEIEVCLRSVAADDDASFERRVQRAASEVVAHLDAGLRVGLRTDRARLACGAGRSQRARLLSFLACVGRDGSAATPPGDESLRMSA